MNIDNDQKDALGEECFDDERVLNCSILPSSPDGCPSPVHEPTVGVIADGGRQDVKVQFLRKNSVCLARIDVKRITKRRT